MVTIIQKPDPGTNEELGVSTGVIIGILVVILIIILFFVLGGFRGGGGSNNTAPTAPSANPSNPGNTAPPSSGTQIPQSQTNVNIIPPGGPANGSQASP